MKKREIIELVIDKANFGGKGEGSFQGKRILFDGGLPGQKVQALVKLIRKDRVEAKILEVLEKSPLETEDVCGHFGICGGCSMLSLPYEEQLKLKEKQLRDLFRQAGHDEIDCPQMDFSVLGSPASKEYKNKMEFSFGNETKDGPLTLGMHIKGKSNSVTTVSTCQIIDEDYRRILLATQEFFAKTPLKPYRILSHEGHLRHLVLRKGQNTGEILLNLVTTSQSLGVAAFEETVENSEFQTEATRLSYEEGEPFFEDKVDLQNQDCSALVGEETCQGKPFFEEEDFLNQWVEIIGNLELKGQLTGILHTINNSLSDIVAEDEMRILRGRTTFMDVVLGKEFEISPFSFFQTNTGGTEVLYALVREMVSGLEIGCKENPAFNESTWTKRKIIFDLYSGTGTIGILLADLAEKVVSIELIEEAVAMARENARRNNCINIRAIAGDVVEEMRKIGEEEGQPELIVLDPPRSGIHPKAMGDILSFQAKEILYISCNPKALMLDLKTFKTHGYEINRIKAVDLFPNTNHVETVVLMSRVEEMSVARSL